MLAQVQQSDSIGDDGNVSLGQRIFRGREAVGPFGNFRGEPPILLEALFGLCGARSSQRRARATVSPRGDSPCSNPSSLTSALKSSASVDLYLLNTALWVENPATGARTHATNLAQKYGKAQQVPLYSPFRLV